MQLNMSRIVVITVVKYILALLQCNTCPHITCTLRFDSDTFELITGYRACVCNSKFSHCDSYVVQDIIRQK